MTDKPAGSMHVTSAEAVLERLRGGLIVSVQAAAGEPLRDPRAMDLMARSCVAGGAVGVRAQGLSDLTLICQHVDVPVIGLWRDGDQGVVTTPTLTHALAVATTGAQIVAVDGTSRPRPDALSLARTVEGLRSSSPGTLVMADCGSADDARAAQDAGVDLLGTALAGCTGDRPVTDGPDLELLEEILGLTDLPVVAEGRVRTPEQAAQAIERGAFAVVVGTAITHPTTITSWFADALRGGGQPQDS